MTISNNTSIFISHNRKTVSVKKDTILASNNGESSGLDKYILNQSTDYKESKEYIQSQVERYFPKKEIDHILEHFPHHSINYYHILLKLPSYPAEEASRSKWRDEVKSIFEQRKNAIYSELSQLSFEQVKTLESRFITMLDEKSYKKDQNAIQASLKSTIFSKLSSIEVIEEVLASSHNEIQMLKGRYGNLIVEFSKMVPATFFLDVFSELTFAGHYAIPINEPNVPRWISKLSKSIPRMSQVADEIIFGLKKEGYGLIDNTSVLKDAIIMVMKEKVNDISKMIEATRSLDLNEEMFNEVTEMYEQAPEIDEILYKELFSSNREILRLFTNRFYEKRRASRLIENQLLAAVCKGNGELQQMYQSNGENRLKVTMLLRLALKTRSLRGKHSEDIEELQERVGDLQSYTEAVQTIINEYEKTAPKPIQDYLTQEQYLKDAKSFDNEIHEVDLSINAMRFFETKNIIIRRQVSVLKLAFYLATNYEPTIGYYNQNQDMDNISPEELKNLSKESIFQSDEVRFFIRILYKLLPDKVQLVFTTEDLIPEVMAKTFKIYSENVKFLHNISGVLKKQPNFAKIIESDPNKAATLIANIIIEKKLNAKYIGEWDTNKFCVSMLTEVLKQMG